MIDGFTMWKLHRAIKLHLLTLKYDVFASRGNVSGMTMDKFQKQNDKKIFEILGRNFEKSQDAVQFFVANIAYSGKDSVYDTGLAWENYKLWMKHKESLTKLILDDIELLDISTDLTGNPPRLLQGVISGKILPETAVAINRFHPYIDNWVQNQKSLLGVNNWAVIIKKLDKFVKFNEVTISNALEQQHV